ncbi:hypothetical protein CKO27_15650, partial [Thiocystis violacea]|nr:hypothetical protein [Thiocystis violacea]
MLNRALDLSIVVTYSLQGGWGMDKGSLAAMELMVFLGLAGWLVYYQFVSSRRGSDPRESESGGAVEE